MYLEIAPPAPVLIKLSPPTSIILMSGAFVNMFSEFPKYHRYFLAIAILCIPKFCEKGLFCMKTYREIAEVDFNGAKIAIQFRKIIPRLLFRF